MQNEDVAVKLLHCNIKFSSGCIKDLTNVRKAKMQLYTNIYVHIRIYCELCIFVSCACTCQISRIHPYVMHTPQRMNLKHPNVLELLGVTQGHITCLVMPSVQRRSIQVCGSVAPSKYIHMYIRMFV